MSATHGAAHPEIAEIRLFGSLARGTANPYADADLLVVLDATDLPFRDRLPRYKPMGSPVPVPLDAGNRFVRRMVDDSILLYVRETE